MLTSDALVRTRSLKGEEGKAVVVVAAVGVGQEGVVLEVPGEEEEEEEGEQNSAQD